MAATLNASPALAGTRTACRWPWQAFRSRRRSLDRIPNFSVPGDRSASRCRPVRTPVRRPPRPVASSCPHAAVQYTAQAPLCHALEKLREHAVRDDDDEAFFSRACQSFGAWCGAFSCSAVRSPFSLCLLSLTLSSFSSFLDLRGSTWASPIVIWVVRNHFPGSMKSPRIYPRSTPGSFR